MSPGEAQLVIEVAASSLAYDKGLKPRLYARHRVRGVLGGRRQYGHHLVHTGPNGDAWSSVVTHGPQDALTTSALPGFSIRLSEIA